MRGYAIGIRGVFSALLLFVVLATLPDGAAEAKLKASQCSGENQPACPALYKGPRCDAGLGNFGGTCRKCGGEGLRACPPSAKGKPCFGGRMKIDGRCYAQCGGPDQKACAKIKKGFPCRGSYEPDSNGFCKPCGGDGQTVCRALKAGKQCQPGLTRIDGACYRCGGNGERACPALKAGRQCDEGTAKFGDRCYTCGGPNQRACPKLAKGFPCRGNYEPDSSNICKPCGGDGQTACRALKAGKQCQPGLTRIDGSCYQCGGNGERACPALKAGRQCDERTAKFGDRCYTCGGPNQRACPKLAKGFPCRGNYEPDSSNICKPCGGKGEKACRVLKAGRQCEVGSTARGGVCVTCGGEGQRACKLTDRGKPCEEGLKRTLKGICVISVEEATRRRAVAELSAIGGDLLPALNGAISANRDDRLKQGIRNESDDVEVPQNELCAGKKYQSWTLGVGGEVGAVVSVEGEAGVAMRCASQHARGQKDLKWYTSGSANLRLGFGAGAAFTYGMWKDPFDQLRGKSHGYVFDFVDLALNIKAVALKEGLDSVKKIEPDFSVGLWFERRDEDGDGADDEVGRFLGFTVSIGGSAGWDTGVGYVAATTSQVCTADMKCAEGAWVGHVGGREMSIFVDGQTKNHIYASIDDGPRTKFDRATAAGRKYKNADGDIIRYRKNYRKLKFESRNDAKGDLERVAIPLPEGVWKGEVGGRATTIYVDEVVDHTFFDKLFAKGDEKAAMGEQYLYASVDGGPRERFERKGGSYKYESENGDSIRFRKNFTRLNYNAAGRGGKGTLTRDDNATVPVAASGIDVLGQWRFTVKGRTMSEEFVEQKPDYIMVQRLGTDLQRRYDKTADNEYASEYGGTFRFVTGNRAIWISPDKATVFQLNKQ